MNSATLDMFDSVRAVLQGRPFSEEQQRDLAMRVSETAEMFRRRADRAVRYARQGLLLEAAQEVEAEPSLFALAQHLDSDEVQLWRSMCTRHDWPTPQPMDVGALEEIEEAIAQLRPLRSLLARMRTLVLGDAGAWERLQVLRELARRDEHNPAWQADMQALEPVAVEWLAEQTRQAIRAGRLTDAEEHLASLETGGWQWTAPGPQLSGLRAQLDAAVVEECKEAAPALVQTLEQEWAAQHEEGVAAELEAWRRLEERAAVHGGSLPAQLVERVAMADAWLAERREAARALAEHQTRAVELERLLDGDQVTLPRLRQALAACEATAEGCPEPLRRRARDEIVSLERRRNARRSFTVAGVLLLVVGATGAIWYGVMHRTRANRVETLATAVESLVAAGQLEEAGRLLNEAEGGLEMTAHARVSAARQAYVDAREAIARNDRGFRESMLLAGDPTAVDARPDAAEQAAQLARTEAQHEAVSEWRRLYRQALDARISAQTQEQLAELAEVARMVAAGKADPTGTAFQATLTEAQSRLDSLVRAAQGSPTVLAEAQRVQLLLDAQRQALQVAYAQRDRVTELRGLARLVDNPEALRAALERFVQEHAGTPQAAAVAEAATTAPLWKGMAEWNTLLQGRRAATLPQRERDAIHAQVEEYARANPSSPLAEPARAYAALLRPVESWRVWINDKLKRLPAFGYYMVELKDGTRMYTLQDPVRLPVQSEGSGRPYCIVPALTAGGADPRTAFQRVETSAIRTQGPSPQMTLGRQLQDRLQDAVGPEGPNGVQLALDVLAQVRDAGEVDGAFAALLARGVLESLEPELPAALQSQVQEAARRIARARPEQVDWLAGGATARESARAIRQVLKEVLKVEQWRAAYAEAVATAATPLQVRFQPAGLLLEEEHGRTILVPDGRALPPNATLVVLKPGVGNQSSEMVVVGRTDAVGALTLTAQGQECPAGTLVWVRQEGGA